MIWEIILWISVSALVHTYLLYPLILRIIVSNKKTNAIVYSRDEDLPYVYILLSAYNEEEVIVEKINGLFNTNYPLDKISVIVGSDASNDHTDELVLELAEKYDRLDLIRFDNRSGKVNVINKLVEKLQKTIRAEENIEQQTGSVFILTDANVFLSPSTIFELVKHFKNEDIGVVDAVIQNRGTKKQGIAVQEKTYVQLEGSIKYMEGLAWGTMIGPSGGCYAIRNDLYSSVPLNFLVDDFYIAMKVLEKGYKAIVEKNAICFEDVSSDIYEEFRRKVRISSGNFQNLKVFSKFLMTPYKALGFSFLSHKVLRWIGPIFIILLYLCSLILSFGNIFYQVLFLIQNLVFALVFIELILQRLRVRTNFVRFITHFYLMNLALLIGFIKFLKGVKSSVWEPTKRNQ
ncbi:MAG: glycosyltransferase [Bacteroidetes bacterium]|nr:glycosyltransferase [Bacteroidota bacterium]